MELVKDKLGASACMDFIKDKLGTAASNLSERFRLRLASVTGISVFGRLKENGEEDEESESARTCSVCLDRPRELRFFWCAQVPRDVPTKVFPTIFLLRLQALTLPMLRLCVGASYSGHMVCCKECAQQLDKCPFCRSKVVDVRGDLKLYREPGEEEPKEEPPKPWRLEDKMLLLSVLWDLGLVAGLFLRSHCLWRTDGVACEDVMHEYFRHLHYFFVVMLSAASPYGGVSSQAMLSEEHYDAARIAFFFFAPWLVLQLVYMGTSEVMDEARSRKPLSAAAEAAQRNWARRA